MSTSEDGRPSRAEASTPAFPTTSADRARFWAGLNRCVEADAAPARESPPRLALVPVHRRTTDDHA